MIQFSIRVFAVTMLATAWAICGFSQESLLLRVHVPFNFVVGQANLPAGDYTVEQDSTSGVVTLQNQSAKSSAAVLSSNGNLRAEGSLPKLVFESRGDKKVLTQIRTTNEPSRILFSYWTGSVSH